MRKPIYWIIILAVAGVLVYFIAPQLIGKLTAFIIALCAAVFGLFFRKKRA
jgi:hypothetical protein